MTAAFCAAVLLCGLSTTAYAGGGEEWEGLAQAEPATTEEPAEPTVTPGEQYETYFLNMVDEADLLVACRGSGGGGGSLLLR